jgi:hypothetical protein
VRDSGLAGQDQSPSFPKWNRGEGSKRAEGNPAEGVTSHSSLATSRCISNRYTPRVEPPVTHSKQTTVVPSNRYKIPPSRKGTKLQPLPTSRPLAPVLLAIRRGLPTRAHRGGRGLPPSSSSLPHCYSGISLRLRASRHVCKSAPHRGTTRHPAHRKTLVLRVLGWSFTGTARPLTGPQVVGKIFVTAKHRPQRPAGSRKLGSGTRRALLFQMQSAVSELVRYSEQHFWSAVASLSRAKPREHRFVKARLDSPASPPASGGQG